MEYFKFDDKEIKEEIENPKFEFKEMILDYKTLFGKLGFLLPSLFFLLGIIFLILFLIFNSNMLTTALLFIMGIPSFCMSLAYCIWPFTARILIPFILSVLLIIKSLSFFIITYLLSSAKLTLIENLKRKRAE